MKKRLFRLLGAVLLSALLPALALPVLAEGEPKETFIANGELTVKGEHITVSSQRIDEEGWWGGNVYTLTVQADAGYTITDIEAEVGSYGNFFGNIVISGGYKRESGSVPNGSTVHFDRIYSSQFQILPAEAPSNIELKKLTVSYWKTSEPCEEHSHQWEEICSVCGTKRQSTDESDAYGVSPESGIGSLFFGKNLPITVGAVCAVVFGVGGYLIGKKKRAD